MNPIKNLSHKATGKPTIPNKNPKPNMTKKQLIEALEAEIRERDEIISTLKEINDRQESLFARLEGLKNQLITDKDCRLEEQNKHMKLLRNTIQYYRNLIDSLGGNNNDVLGITSFDANKLVMYLN